MPAPCLEGGDFAASDGAWSPPLPLQVPGVRQASLIALSFLPFAEVETREFLQRVRRS